MPDPSRSALTPQEMKWLWRNLEDFSRDYRYSSAVDYVAVQKVMNLVATRIREVEDHLEQQSTAAAP